MMSTLLNPNFRWLAALAAVLALSGTVEAAPMTMQVYLSPPKDMSTPIASGTVTQTFNSATLGNTTSPLTLANYGTYNFSSTSVGRIVANDQYGGASNSQYLAFGAQSGTSAPITLSVSTTAFPTGAHYFGFWWSAADNNNGISFYSGGQLLVRYTNDQIMAILSSGGTTITAVNGTTYNKSAYFGNPNTGTNAGTNPNEKYSYVSFNLVGGTFDRIVFDNSGTTGTGFESDNHTLYSLDATTSLQTSVLVQTTAVPEPGTLALGALALLGGVLAVRKVRARRNAPVAA